MKSRANGDPMNGRNKTLGSFQPKPIVVSSTGWKSTAPEKLNAEIIVARAGTRIICPKCGVLIGRLYSDLYSGVSCRADQIEFEPGQTRHRNQKAECAKCGEGYMKMHMSWRNGTTIMLSIEISGRQTWI